MACGGRCARGIGAHPPRRARAARDSHGRLAGRGAARHLALPAGRLPEAGHRGTGPAHAHSHDSRGAPVGRAPFFVPSPPAAAPTRPGRGGGVERVSGGEDVKRVAVALGVVVLFWAVGFGGTIGISRLVPGWGGRDWEVFRSGVYEVVAFGAATVLSGRLMSDRTWPELGWPRPVLVPWLRGLALGAVMAALAIGLALAFGARLQLTADAGLWPSVALPLLLGLVLAALAEELGFRGFPLRRLTDSVGVFP